MQAAYKQLALAAAGLNSASDELGQVIGVLDEALKRLNLGVSAWVEISGNDDRDGYHWWSRAVGYSKLADKWGIALRTSAGDHRFPDDDSSDASLFNDAPRWMRIEAVGRLPELLERLVKQTEETTRSLKKKTAQASEIAQAICKLTEASGEQK